MPCQSTLRFRCERTTTTEPFHQADLQDPLFLSREILTRGIEAGSNPELLRAGRSRFQCVAHPYSYCDGQTQRQQVDSAIGRHEARPHPVHKDSEDEE